MKRAKTSPITYVLDDLSPTGTTERFNRKVFAFLHFVVVPRLYDRDALAAVDFVLGDRVSCQVLDRLDWIGLLPNATFASRHDHFVRLHDLLNCCADVTHPNIDPRFGNTRVRRVLDGFDEIIVGRLEVQREGTVADSALDLNADINFHDITLLQD